MPQAKSIRVLATRSGILIAALVAFGGFTAEIVHAADDKPKPPTTAECRRNNKAEKEACLSIPSWYKGPGLAKLIYDCEQEAEREYFACLKQVKIAVPRGLNVPVKPTTTGNEPEQRSCAKGSIACNPAVGNGVAP